MGSRSRHVPRARRWLTGGVVALTAVAALGGVTALAVADRGPAPTAATAQPQPDPLSDPVPDPVPDGGAPSTAAPRRAGATRLADASPLPSSAPRRLRIPAIGVATDVVDLGLTEAGELEVPAGAFPAGWYAGSPTPGTLGPAVLAGHVSYDGTPGVFERLSEVVVGDRVSVLRADGRVADFRVTRTRHYPKTRFPSEAVYGDLGHAGLRLITCGGLDAATSTYRDNVVVYARLTGVRPA